MFVVMVALHCCLDSDFTQTSSDVGSCSAILGELSL